MVTTHLLEQMRLPFDRAPVLEVSPDSNAYLVALALALVTGVVFGLVPAMQASKRDVTSQLRNETAGAGTRRSRAIDVLVAAQLSASLVLLVAAGLFIRALDRGSRVDPGFDATGITTMSLDSQGWGYDEAKARAFFRSLRESVEGQPGVAAVTYAGFAPMSMSGTGGRISVGGRNDGSDASRRGPNVQLMHVDADYFSVVSVPLVSGRPLLTTDDARAPLVAVVNETLARRFWPDGSALGSTFTYGDRTFTVVGIARDVKYDRIDEVIPPVVYFAMEPEWLSSRVMLVRTLGNPEAMTRALQDAVLAIDSRLPRPTVATLERANRVVLLPQRIAAVGTGLLGALGLLMATVGLYGIVSHSVGRRTREIGVRVALGARRSDVLGMVVREGLRLTGIGVVLGLVAAVAVTRLLSRFLLDVDPLDVVTFGGTSLLFVAVAAVASYLPAKRAASADPVSALRSE
jgi:predicted permease